MTEKQTRSASHELVPKVKLLHFAAIRIIGCAVTVLAFTMLVRNSTIFSKVLPGLDTPRTLGASDVSNASTRTQELNTQYHYWKNIVALHPDYRDGLFTLATLAYQLQHFEESTHYLEKVAELDPNYEAINELREALKNK